MKKYILSLALVLGSVFCFGQTFRSEVTGKLLDTVTNTAVKYQKAIAGSPKAGTAVQVTVTKISGTVGGVVRLFGSLDGNTFVRVAPTDSLTASNVATQAKIFTLDKPLYQFLRISYTGTGTMVASFKALAVSSPLK